MNRGQKLDLIIAHNEELKWFQDEVAKIEADKERRAEIVRRKVAREHEYSGLPPSVRLQKEAEITAEIEAEVE